MNPSAYKLLVEALVKQSEANDYSDAVREWNYMYTEELHDSNCICGVRILYVNVFLNSLNKKTINVGCECF